MGFSDQSFNTRFGTMGDPAEEAFDQQLEGKTHALGLNRPNFTMRNMTLAMRYTPDRMTRHHLVEVMGIGRDQTLKIKDEKVEALGIWENIGPVHLFVYDQKNGRTFQAPIEEWRQALDEHGEPDMFPEGKSYRRLHARHFPEGSEQ